MLLLGLYTHEAGLCEKGCTSFPLREGEREEGRETKCHAPIVDFPQDPLLIVTIITSQVFFFTVELPKRNKYNIIVMLTLLLLVVALTIHPANCELGHLWNELENSLISDTENLITLQNMFYPTNSIPKNTVEINIAFTLNSTKLDCEYWIDDCDYWVFDQYDINGCRFICGLSLSIDSNSESNTYFKLKNHIEYVHMTDFMIFSEYGTFVLLEALTFSKLVNKDIYHRDQINIELNGTHSSCGSVFDMLLSILSWVSSMFNLCHY